MFVRIGNNLGGPLDFHQKFGDSDPYDRKIQYGGKIFFGYVKFFDSRQLYGKLILEDDIDDDNPLIKELKRENLFFKAVDALGEEYPFQIKRGQPAYFKLYYSDKYGWGAFDVSPSHGQVWPSYKKMKLAEREKAVNDRKRKSQHKGLDSHSGKTSTPMNLESFGTAYPYAKHTTPI